KHWWQECLQSACSSMAVQRWVGPAPVRFRRWKCSSGAPGLRFNRDIFLVPVQETGMDEENQSGGKRMNNAQNFIPPRQPAESIVQNSLQFGGGLLVTQIDKPKLLLPQQMPDIQRIYILKVPQKTSLAPAHLQIKPPQKFRHQGQPKNF